MIQAYRDERVEAKERAIWMQHMESVINDTRPSDVLQELREFKALVLPALDINPEQLAKNEEP